MAGSNYLNFKKIDYKADTNIYDWQTAKTNASMCLDNFNEQLINLIKTLLETIETVVYRIKIIYLNSNRHPVDNVNLPLDLKD